jgi:nucleoside triphosphate diphosphatase
VAGPPAEPGEAIDRLDALTRRLRRECPWDREQDERSIVPHTVEEAYELADAAHAGDDAKLLDELGDVLFQVMFLSLLLEERGAGDLPAVAEHCRQKLIRRHPHVFGDVEAERAADVVRNWDAIKRREAGPEAGIFGEVPEILPGTLYARKMLRRAGAAGREGRYAEEPLELVRRGADRLEEGAGDTFEAGGEMLLAAVAAARQAGVDPELALRAAAERFKSDVEEAEAQVE